MRARTFASYLYLLCLLLAAGCGGGAASSSATTTTEGGDEPAAATVEDPTEGGRRRAAQGDDCDYGGAALRTCQIGLYCCYGPPDNPGEHGSCMPECPEY